MSILIKGMEMPTSCGNCFFDTRCDNWRLRNWGAPPPDDCPLIPVPDHGRLGDLDALKNELQSRLEKEDDGWMASEIKMAQRAMRVADYNIIKSAPTIIPADPAKEGK